MIESFREGGFGMIPTLVFGVMLVLAAAQYARTPERRFVPLQVSLGVVTLASGALGFVTGVIKSFSALGQVGDKDRWIWALGVGESAQNLVLALGLVTLAAAAASVGALRVARSAGAA